MKKHIFKHLAISVCIGSLLFISAGCSKKAVVPPSSGIGMDDSGGTNINYPDAQANYSENNLSAEGSLDDSDATSSQGFAGMGSNADQQSYEYKKMHGRSSANLEPIYFEFDQAGIQSSMTDIIMQNADYINSVPGRAVVLEGNSDERGTAEYNLALGERRAITTEQYLISLGVDPDRLRTLSYGEEKPLFQGEDEATYDLNRRVDFIMK